MASEQIGQNEFIVQAVAEATRVVIQTWPQLPWQDKKKCRNQDQQLHPATTSVQLERRGQIGRAAKL